MEDIETKDSRCRKETENAVRLSSWFAGEEGAPAAAAHSILVQSGGDVRAVLNAGLAASGAHVFSDAPSCAVEGADIQHVTVEGEVELSGDELIVSGNLYVQVFDYGSLPYLSVAGPTVVRMTCPEDYEAFLADADRAVREGDWAEGLAHPSVQLADVRTLAAPDQDTGLGRLYITSDGQVRTGIGGAGLGAVGAGATAVQAALDTYAGDPSLDSVVPRQLLSAGAAERPWLGRYVRALDVRRRLARKHGTDIRVSGFGGRFTPELPSRPVEAADQPLLLEISGDTYAVRAGDCRLFRMGRGSARLLEVFSTLRTAGTTDVTAEAAMDEAAARAGRLLGIPADEALRAYAAVAAHLASTAPIPGLSDATGGRA
ncbi:daptide biosynthesis RiPP recognition protein [Streptomyces sp. NPDC006711]|uniref:daptide biosynthesis RiPP recognition protein n=1 Tax=Streptomyces sp. NPDC006711 TaxID=3364762 RepID=UPI00367D94D7